MGRVAAGADHVARYAAVVSKSCAAIRSGLALSAFPVGVYAAAFAIARISPQASLAVYASAPVLYFLAITLLRALAPRESAEHEFT